MESDDFKASKALERPQMTMADVLSAANFAMGRRKPAAAAAATANVSAATTMVVVAAVIAFPSYRSTSPSSSSPLDR